LPFRQLTIPIELFAVAAHDKNLRYDELGKLLGVVELYYDSLRQAKSIVDWYYDEAAIDGIPSFLRAQLYSARV
jgi:hypothetical protein